MKRTKKRSSKFRVLSCDPSLTAFGFVIIEDKKVLHTGCIKTTPSDKKLRIRKGDDRTRRVSEINQILIEAIETYQVSYITAELPHGSQSYDAAVTIGLMAALIQTLGDALDIPVEWFSEADAKKCLFGTYGNITKSEVVYEIDSKYKVPWPNAKYKKEAIADAIAVYNVAYKNSHVIRTFCKRS